MQVEEEEVAMSIGRWGWRMGYLLILMLVNGFGGLKGA